MIAVTTIADLRAALLPRRSGRVGFVPTMGNLHEGHLDLVRAARRECDTVVLSIFVNPTQFEDPADLARYPRTTDQDLALAAASGVDVVFLPTPDEMYPDGFATTVSVSGPIVERLEGVVRGRSHFDGVATIVAKLLLAVLADVAYFGEKDAQQVVVVTRMTADLGIPVAISVVPTSRDADGLARSSRNARLSADERSRALAVPRALARVRDAARGGETDAEILRAVGRDALAGSGLELEYLDVVDPRTLLPVATLEADALVAIAARAGATRLIDNVTISAAPPRSTP